MSEKSDKPSTRLGRSCQKPECISWTVKLGSSSQ